MNGSRTDAQPGDRLFALLQLLLPTHLMSRVVHWLMRVELSWVKNRLIRLLMKGFDISLADAVVQDPQHFRSFNDFFTRALRPETRPLPQNARTLACPVDGRVYQLGSVTSGRIFQAKGQSFSLLELLGGDSERARPFDGGEFATLYLAPHNYHRIHMPAEARLREMVYVPGRLFSVNPATTRAMPNLFARNERVVAIFDSSVGPMAMVLVGALFVGSIETVWAGEVTPPHRGSVQSTRYDLPGLQQPGFARGQEMGRFNMGSTVVLLFGPKAVRWSPGLAPHHAVRMGQVLAEPGF